MKRNTIPAAAGLALAVVLLAATGLSAQDPAPPPSDAPLPDIVVEVKGLSCPFCAFGIEKKFVERTEVDSVFVALGENEVRLWLKPDHQMSDEAVRKTVEEAGFSAGAIRRPSKEGEEEA